ncbi:MAG TPA: sugar phosphate isomerase/epimerase [Bacteroidales bacterium]|nr:sugar phosphate isomerase/epimerase [Bacteroidales bacterium]HNS46582.1 sugar phosphate isomerase/epimerase [Bacteroidales bacterium]
MKTRREFLKTVGVLSASTVVLRAFPSCSVKKDIGLQLYTLRDTIEKDTLPMLEQVSRIGYSHIEPYGFDGNFYGIPAHEFRRIVEDMGMRITCTHSGISSQNADAYLEAAVKAGLEYIVLPSPGGRKVDTADDYRRMAAEMNKIGEKARQAGIRFGYHNHSGEFSSGDEGVFYDILLRDTDPELVCFQLDIFWIIKGGYEPVAYFRKYPGRFALWHVKDMDPSGESTVIGKGSIDYREIFTFAEQAGMEYFYVEQESYTKSPIESVKDSYNYIRNNLI